MATNRFIQAKAAHKPYVGASGNDRLPPFCHAEEKGKVFLRMVANVPGDKTEKYQRKNNRHDKLSYPLAVSGEKSLWSEMFNMWLDASL